MSTKYNTPGTADWNSQISSSASNDDVRFNTGGDTLTDNLSQAAKDFLAVRFWKGTTVRMAENAALVCDIDQTGTGVLEFLSDSRLINHGGGSTGFVERVLCAPSGGGTLTLGLAACTYRKVEAFAGKLMALSAGVITNLWAGLSGRVELASCATAVTAVEAEGQAVVATRRNMTTCNIGQRATVVLDTTGLSITTLTMRGGTLRPDGGGTVGTTATLLDGVIDCSKMEKDLDLSGATVTLGAGLKIIPSAAGAKIIWPAEASITFRGPKPEGYRQ